MADPVTLLTLITATAALAGTGTRARPIAPVEDDAHVMLPHVPTALNLLVGRLPDTALEFLPVPQLEEGPRDRTIRTLKAIAADGSRAAHEALTFLEAIPQYLPCPKATCSESGLITVFWETPELYADAEFSGNGKFSVFTRNRTKKEDAVLDEHPLEDADGEWLREYLGPLLPRAKHAEAA